MLRNSGEALTDGETLSPETQSGATAIGAQSGAGTTVPQVSEDWGEIEYEATHLWQKGDRDWISLLLIWFDSELFLNVASNTLYYTINPIVEG
jgi:hypothetical protein